MHTQLESCLFFFKKIFPLEEAQHCQCVSCWWNVKLLSCATSLLTSMQASCSYPADGNSRWEMTADYLLTQNEKKHLAVLLLLFVSHSSLAHSSLHGGGVLSSRLALFSNGALCGNACYVQWHRVLCMESVKASKTWLVSHFNFIFIEGLVVVFGDNTSLAHSERKWLLSLAADSAVKHGKQLQVFGGLVFRSRIFPGQVDNCD